jgi:SNF family Na+-dependent transporter
VPVWAERTGVLGKLFKYIFVLALLGAALTAGYALFFDLPPPSREIVVPVEPAAQ